MGARLKTLPLDALRRAAARVGRLPSRQKLGELIWAARLDLAILGILTLVAAVPRLVLLADVPPGLHGDEAWTGIDAQRVLDEGWIGPYVGSALGQPSGPLYFAAPVVAVFGESVFSVRLSMALLGIATVPIAYLAFRTMFDRTVGVFGALLLAFGLWHLHYSRLAFMVISWPLMEMLTLYFLFLGIKTGRWLHYALAGFALGLGTYTYNAYPIFALPLGLFLVWQLARQPGSERLRFAKQVGLMAAAAVLAAIPLIIYAANPDHNFLTHHQDVSIFESGEVDWDSRGLLDKGQLLLERTGGFYKAAFWSGSPDGGDGAGDSWMVDRVSVFLMAAGAGVLIWRWRRPAAVAVLLMVLLLPMGSVISLNGTFRRTLGVVPFLVLLGAVPLALWWDRSGRLTVRWRTASYGAIVAVVGLIGFLNLNAYFGDFRGTEVARFTFGEQLTEATALLDDLPSDTYVYFYSDRWGFSYETRRYLASDAEGEDRSAEFGSFTLERDRGGEVAYVFLGPYVNLADEVGQLYPGGTRFESLDGDGDLQVSAYLLGPDDRFALQSEPDTADGTSDGGSGNQDPGPDGEARDGVRQEDLGVIANALEQYRNQNGSYPSTGGGVQSLCVFGALDAGCDLSELLGTMSADPLGDAENNGYWYSSTGDEFVVFAQRESDELPECAVHPDHLERIASLLCRRGR